MGSSITNTISMGITLGSGAYTSPLVITNTGEIYPTQSRQYGVQMGAGYLSNSGTIYGGPNGGSGVRIFGGTLFNNAVISPGYGGAGYGILLEGGDVNNRGTVTGNSGRSAIFQEGGTLQNYGVIENLGTFGYGIFIASGTLINDGTIYSKNNGVLLEGGSVLNDAFITSVLLDGGGLVNNGTIESVESRYGGSFTNAGSIGSVRFGTGASRIIVDPGAVFSGPVQASGSASREVIELASGVNSGTITGVGSQFNDFGVIAIDAGALWTIEGNASGLASGQTITGFASGDTLILDGFSATGETFVSPNALELTSGSTSLTIDIMQPTGLHFDFSTFGGDTTIDLACFATGTRILTPKGDILVEDLSVGDTVVTVREGGPAISKIIWTGQRTIDIMRHHNPAIVRPVRILAGAFGNGLPERDLRLSPHHAVYIDGALFEVVALVNGLTIIEEHNTRYVTYHHIELEQHDIVLAEGLPAESFLDTGNRDMFGTTGGVLQLHADFRTEYNAQTCVPLHRQGPEVARVHGTLLNLARALAERPCLQIA
jgi:hypothetical protein